MYLFLGKLMLPLTQMNCLILPRLLAGSQRDWLDLTQ